MLNAVSWSQFTIFLLVGASGYYLYVGLRFYRRELWGRLAGRGQQKNVVVPASTDDGNVLFREMEQVIARIKGIVDKAVIDPAEFSNLLDHVQELLKQHKGLKGTAYERAVNGFLARACSTSFSLVLSDEQLSSLWG